jgi:hypothetical protein
LKVDAAERMINALKVGDNRPWNVVIDEFIKSLLSRKLIISLSIMIVTFIQTGDFTVPAITGAIYGILNVLEKKEANK